MLTRGYASRSDLEGFQVLSDSAAEVKSVLGLGASFPDYQRYTAFTLPAYADLLIDAHQFYDEAAHAWKPRESSREDSMFTVPGLKRSDYGDSKYFEHLLAADAACRSWSNKARLDVAVFGSLADLELAPGFSDFDLLLRIKRSAFESTESLLATRAAALPIIHRTYLFNPLQHHAPFPLLESDDVLLPDHLLARDLFRYMKVLGTTGPTDWKIGLFTWPSGRKTRLLDRLAKVEASPKNPPQDIWHFQQAIASFFLLAPLYAHVCNRPSYKPLAFDYVRTKHPGLDWDLHDEISQLRCEAFSEITPQLEWLRAIARYDPRYVRRVARRLGFFPQSLRRASRLEVYERMRAFALALRKAALKEGLI